MTATLVLSGFCALLGYVPGQCQSADLPRRPSMAAAHRAIEWEARTIRSLHGNGGCHVGALLPQAPDGRPNHGLLAWASDRALRDGAVRTGVLGPQHYSAGSDPDGVRGIHRGAPC